MINPYLSAISEPQKFINCRPDADEVRKALAVKLVYQVYKYEEIQIIKVDHQRNGKFTASVPPIVQNKTRF